jgi:Lon protease-like protein
MERPRTEIPLFELPLVAVPGERVPLHIFEERYRRMFADCRDDGSPLAILLRTDGGTSSIGCAVELTEVLEEFGDGRLNVIVTGRHRIRIVDRREGEDYPLATVEQLPEGDGGAADPGPALAAFERLLAAAGSTSEPAPTMRSAFEIAARVELPVATKQALLECDSEAIRLETLRETLDALVEGAERSRQVAERAAGNGHAPI